MPPGDFVDRVMDVFDPLFKEPNWHEFCQACDTMLMSDRSLCCTPLQPAKHGLLTLGDELAADWSNRVDTSDQRASAGPSSVIRRACSMNPQRHVPVATASRFTPELMKDVAPDSMDSQGDR